MKMNEMARSWTMNEGNEKKTMHISTRDSLKGVFAKTSDFSIKSGQCSPYTLPLITLIIKDKLLKICCLIALNLTLFSKGGEGGS